MLTIGIAGGTGAGKTSALRAISALGGEILDCDAVYRTMLETCAPLREDLHASFPGIFDGSGKLDRKKLGEMVFQDKHQMERLNEVVFRHLMPEIQRRIQESTQRLCAIDAINLLESGLDSICDRTVAITAPLELRVRRIMARDGISEQYARLRIAAQKSDEFYRSRCDEELSNAADTPEEFEAQAKDFFQRLIETVKEEKQQEA